MLLRRATLLSQPENGKVYSLGDYVAVRSETIDWFMCVISEVNDPSKEVKVRFMRKSGQYFLLSKKLEKCSPKSLFWNFSPQKCRKLFLSKIEVLTPWFSEIAKMVIANFCVQGISMITGDTLTRV